MKKNYIVDGYSFQSKNDFERAKKEQETIAYLTANTNMADMKAVYKIYKRAVEKQSFQTVFGLNYLEELRKRLIGSETVSEELLEPIPVGRVSEAVSENSSEKQAQKYQKEYEKAKAGSLIKNFLIGALFVIIVVMVVITYKSQYSVFTYFTNYKENMRNEILNEYEDWESQLKEREEKVEQEEKAKGTDIANPSNQKDNSK